MHNVNTHAHTPSAFTQSAPLLESFLCAFILDFALFTIHNNDDSVVYIVQVTYLMNPCSCHAQYIYMRQQQPQQQK